jgi:hypothetical protein
VADAFAAKTGFDPRAENELAGRELMRGGCWL